MRAVKRIMAGLLAAVLFCLPVLAEGEAVRVSALKGPTAMGLVKMMDDAGYSADTSEDTDGSEAAGGYTFEIAASPDLVTPMIAKGETDIAALPANLASILYNNTNGGVRVIAVNTLGVLYIVDTNGSVASVSDLAGKTIYASGKGSTPEYALSYILRGNGLDPDTDVQIEWKSEHAECLAALLADPEGIAMLPQPFVTTAQMKNDSIRVALDLNEEWDRLQEGAADGGEDTGSSILITGVTVVRTQFLTEHPEAVDQFLTDYAASVSYVNENLEESAALIGAYDIVPEAVAMKALPACSITCITGEEMKEKLSGYLQVLFDANPDAVGKAVPGEDFYYVSE